MKEATDRGRLSKWPIVAVEFAPMSSSETPSGDQIRRAREALRLTQQQLADQLGVGLRTVGRWERDEAIPRSAVGALVQVLKLSESGSGSEAAAEADDPTLRTASHAQLIAELARRIESAPRPDAGNLPAVPTGRYRFPKSNGPSARARIDREQREPDNEQSM